MDSNEGENKKWEELGETDLDRDGLPCMIR